MMKAFWYTLHAMLEDEEIQRKGVVVIAHPKHSAQSNFDRKLTKMNVESLSGCIPVPFALVLFMFAIHRGSLNFFSYFEAGHG